MTDADILQRLADAGWTLPKPAAPVGAYAPAAENYGLLMVSGQAPLDAQGTLVRGKVGEEVSLADAKRAASLCALQILAQARVALDGDLTRVRRCLRIGGFVNAGPDFVDHPKVLDGASEIMLLAFAEAGRASRFAVGASSLPLGMAVEAEATFAVA